MLSAIFMDMSSESLQTPGQPLSLRHINVCSLIFPGQVGRGARISLYIPQTHTVSTWATALAPLPVQLLIAPASCLLLPLGH